MDPPLVVRRQLRDDVAEKRETSEPTDGELDGTD